MAKTVPVVRDDITIGYMIGCPACKCGHLFYLNNPRSGKPQWSFNGDFDKPTFKPSMLIYPNEQQKRCHSFVTDGKIQFLSDCGHDMAGTVVELEELD